MLSRSAQGLYWMGRYMERAERLCRLLQLQTAALVDKPVREIDFGWVRIYASIDRSPPFGQIQVHDEADYTRVDDFILAESYTLADDLTFERSNPDSVWSCFALGRENARQMRHCISAEMWIRLNLAYLRVQDLSIQDIWTVSPESFYAEMSAEMDTFSGVAASTMYRDEGWSFMQLGRLIERVQLSASLLLAHLDASKSSEEDSEADWISLLRVCHALEAYNRKHSVEARPRLALDLLVTDPQLPASIRRSLDMAAAELVAIGDGPDARSSDAARRLAGRLGSLVRYEWPDRDDLERLLRQIDRLCRDLHQRVSASYFDYEV